MIENDTNLVEGLKKDRLNHFNKIYDKYHKQLYVFAIHYLKDKNLSKDAVQDVFLKLWEKRKKLDDELALKNYLFTMTKNRVLNMIRKEENKKRIIDSLKKTVSNKSHSVTEDEIQLNEYKQLVQKALQKISPAKREVFKMRRFSGMSNAEVAEERNVSIYTVKTQFYHVTKFIRKYLKKHADFG